MTEDELIAVLSKTIIMHSGHITSNITNRGCPGILIEMPNYNPATGGHDGNTFFTISVEALPNYIKGN